MSAFPVAANDTSQPIVLFTTSLELKKIVASAIEESHRQRDERERSQQRLTSKQAAAWLGYSVAHLQELHKQGLPYEKGRPNYYRLVDLEKFQAERRLVIS